MQQELFSVEEVERIANISDPYLRNLEITQCYRIISTVFAERIRYGANWCTFATWASKQAGQTIRKEDLRRAIQSFLKEQPEVEAAVSFLAQAARKSGVLQDIPPLRQAIYQAIIEPAANRASSAVSRGNKKVFEEIALQFARFIQECFPGETFRQGQIDFFCQQLVAGSPPDGQDYLRRAFIRYYSLLFETDRKKLAEGTLYANLLIGFHEQMRLQPEIAEALNAAIDKPWLRKQLTRQLLPKMAFWRRIAQFFKAMFRRESLMDKAIDALADQAQKHLRNFMTAHFMTITFPLNERIKLGEDLSASFPKMLVSLEDQELVALLKDIDPNLNSVIKSGAKDWAVLHERMHFIADMFRCYHESKNLFSEAFSHEQLAQLKAGRLPSGEL